MKTLSTEQRLLFVHQNENQKRLLERDGNEICLLDATYKTTKYSIPLFFFATKTNVDYQVVGSFAVQDETTNAISEAISILKSWNSKTWHPKSFMVDNCEEEILAIEHNLPGKERKYLVHYEEFIVDQNFTNAFVRYYFS